MKRTARFGFFLLLAALLASNAWAGGNKDLQQTRDVTIGNWYMNWDVNNITPSNEIEEATLQMRRSIQTEHNITVRERHVADYWTFLETIIPSILAGRPAAQAFIAIPHWVMTLRRQSLLAALSDSTAVDLTTTVAIPFRQIQYNQAAAQMFTWDGKQYAMAIGYGGSRHAIGIFYNKRLFEEAGLSRDLPYDLQRDGTWNWDRFYEISRTLTRDRRNTGVVDQYAIPEDWKNGILDGFVVSNNAEFIGRDAAGRFINASNTPEFLEALHFVRRLDAEGVVMRIPDGADYASWNVAAFMDGRVAMIIGEEWLVSSFETMTDDFGWVVMPKGPRAADYRISNDENLFVVPSTYKGADLDLILIALNLWNRPVTDDWQAGYWGAYRDRRAVEETMAIIRSPNYTVFKNHMMIPGLEIGDIAWNMFWWGDDPAHLVESVSQSWSAIINDANVVR